MIRHFRSVVKMVEKGWMKTVVEMVFVAVEGMIYTAKLMQSTHQCAIAKA